MSRTILSTCKRSLAIVLSLILLIGTAPGWPVAAAEDEADAPDHAAAPTPARLSYTHGDVSFWRPGGDDWAPAQVNTPLTPGDQLYTGHGGNLEIQIDSRGFVRAWGDSQLGIENHEPDFLQLRIAAGHVSLDLRGLDPGRTIELDTPAAAFTIDRPGYYRVDVTPDRTSFITRRGGVATMTSSAAGQAAAIATSEQVVLDAGAAAGQTFVAPEPDVWDRWNYARTDALVDTVSARYTPQDIAGIDDLDQHGTWRVVSEYGSVWVPQGVPADWVPYTTGRWVWDPRFGWSWVDVAPWGWAPYHYGRWVHLGSVWAWAPGPVVVRPAYAPALVAFFGAPGVRVAVGAPFVSWVALGWGEPCVPWWGRPGFVGRPWWGGWGGPRVVNNVVINRTTVVSATSVTVYRNVGVRNAVVAVRPERFGRGPVAEARIRGIDTRRLEPVRGQVDVRPDRASFAAASGRGVRPPDRVLARPVVATRPPATRALPREAERRAPEPRIVPAPRAGETASRPPLGQSGPERPRPPRAPRFDDDRRLDAPPAARGAEPPTPPGERDEQRSRRPAASRPPEPPREPDASARPHPSPSPSPQRGEGRRQPAQPPAAPSESSRISPSPSPQRGEGRRDPAQPPAAPSESSRISPSPSPQRGEGRVRGAQPPAMQSPRPTPPPAAPARAAERPAVQPPRADPSRARPQPLPGAPANRLYPGARLERPAPRAPETRPLTHPQPSGSHAGGSRGGGSCHQPRGERDPR